MFIIKKPNNNILKLIAKQLKRGAVVVYPTDTAYGLGCDATNARAVARIFKIKGRTKSKALPIICADEKMVKKYFKLSSQRKLGSRTVDSCFCRNDGVILLLTKKHWPGPFAIILKAKKGIAKAALKNNTAAVRVPASRIARTLSKLLGRPLIATSANISGRPACYSVRSFMKQAKGMKIKPERVIDTGALPRRQPSTIIHMSKSGKIEVLRRGPIKI